MRESSCHHSLMSVPTAFITQSAQSCDSYAGWLLAGGAQAAQIMIQWSLQQYYLSHMTACLRQLTWGIAAVQFVNSAVSATTSSYTSQCMQDFVPAAADLVLVEFSVNDWEVVDASTFSWMDNSLRYSSSLRSTSPCFV